MRHDISMGVGLRYQADGLDEEHNQHEDGEAEPEHEIEELTVLV